MFLAFSKEMLSEIMENNSRNRKRPPFTRLLTAICLPSSGLLPVFLPLSAALKNRLLYGF
ncbi:hypothetical protein SAMN05216383_104127 [Prevotella sp. KH2C16]|nr:hypothetical protein SAMN05216383_104127 [Prevotella sp. KH2C16]